MHDFGDPIDTEHSGHVLFGQASRFSDVNDSTNDESRENIQHHVGVVRDAPGRTSHFSNVQVKTSPEAVVTNLKLVREGVLGLTAAFRHLVVVMQESIRRRHRA